MQALRHALRRREAAEMLARIRADSAHPALAGLDAARLIRETPRGSVLVAGRRGAPFSVVLKLYAGAGADLRADRLYAHHRLAFARLDGVAADLRVPEPLVRFETLPGYAMRLVAGRAASAILRRTPFGRARLRADFATRAARWLAAYHRACGGGESRVSARYLARSLRARVEARRAGGTPPIPGADGLCRLLDRLEEAVRGLPGFDFPKAVPHGDFNLHNLIIDGETTWAVDFSGGDPENLRPVSVDLACCLFYLEFRDGWRGSGGAGQPGGFDRDAVALFARHYPGFPWESAGAAWLMLHHQLQQWTSLASVGMAGRAERMEAMCRRGAETLAARL